jgi:signal peptidase II
VIVIGLLVAFFAYLAYFSKSEKRLAYGLITAGAASNLADRISHGCVIDFIKLGPLPIFNIADILITAGTIILIAELAKPKQI